MTTWNDCTQLAATVKQLELPLPAKLAMIMDAAAALEATYANITNTYPTLLIAAAIESDTLTPKSATKIYLDAIDQHVRREASSAIAGPLFDTFALQFAAAIRGDAGAELIISARPIFDTAAQFIADVPFSPDSAKDPASILAMGDDAGRAYRELPRHRAVLDKLFNQLVLPLETNFQLPPSAQPSRPAWPRLNMPPMAWVIDGNHRADLNAAASVRSGVNSYGPGGMWHALRTAGLKARLNTPAEARAIQAAYLDSVVDADAEYLRRNEEITAQFAASRARA